MKIGIAKEITAEGMEHRAILLPQEVHKLVESGHQVFAEKGLGERIHIDDDKYRAAGAKIVSNRKDIFNKDIVVKLKPPLMKEFRMLKNNILFCMLHAEQNPVYAKELWKRGVKAIAMELINNRAGERLIHCSDIGGAQGMIMAFHLSEKIPSQCDILSLGYGQIASGALKIAFSLGANVKILRKNEFPHIRHFIRGKDIIINGISWPKDKRDRREYLIKKDMLSLLSRSAVILDLSVDFPNPIQTCHPTQLNNPVYTVGGVKHISIFGYPGLAPISSARQYSRQVLPVLVKIASTPVDKLPKYITKALVAY